MSPESAGGGEIDHRADVFAAGIVLWEMLAGRRLFRGETDYQTVVLVREAREVTIDGLDPALRTIVRAALTRDASERYQSAQELADALRGYAASRGPGLPTADTSIVVRVIEAEIRRERSLAPIDPRIADIQSEVARMSSIARG